MGGSGKGVEVSSLPKVPFLGAPFARCSVPVAAAWVRDAARSSTFSYLVTPNVDHIVMLNDDGSQPWLSVYREAVANSDLCVNDSRILARLGRLSGQQLGLVPGSDLVKHLLANGAEGLGSIALIGGKTREYHWLREKLPDQRVVHFDPPMGVRESEAAQVAIAEFIEREACDLVLMAFGAPQSEITCVRVKERGKARGVALCIGASVEFLSGAQSRAPDWMQKASLEWLYRLLSEPRRLWHRYLVRGPRVFAIWWARRKDVSS